MKRKNYISITFSIVFLVCMFSSISIPQKFRLTDIPSTEYSIDRIGRQIYFKDFYSDTVRNVDLETLTIANTGRRVLLPYFQNKNHVMLYGNNSSIGDSSKNNLYLYDIDKKSYFLITDTLSFPPFSEYFNSFSPNDSNFFFRGDCFYSSKDSTIHKISLNINVDYNFNDAWPRWSSDTSLVFKSNDTVLAEYFLGSKMIDTLVVTHSFIFGFDYNVKYSILAYSVGQTPEPQQIYFHYKNSKPDSPVFSSVRDDPSPYWNGGSVAFVSLRWSPDERKLAFLIRQYIEAPLTGIYIYSIDSSRIYKATERDDQGVKDFLNWISNDSLIYVDPVYNYIFGMDISSLITTVHKTQKNGSIKNFDIENYPNPFNSSTRINFDIPESGFVTLKVYDILGREIKTLVNKYYSPGEHSINFNAEDLPSGIYFYRLKVNDFIQIKKMILMR